MITEFTHAKYGRVRGTLVNKTPYLCMTDMTRALGITNSNLCKSQIRSNDTIKVKIGKSNTNRVFVDAKYLNDCMFKSTKKDAEKIGEWIHKYVLPKLMNIEEDISKYKDPYSMLQFMEEFHQLRLRNSVLETENRLANPKLKYISKLLGNSKFFDLESLPEVIMYPGLTTADLFKMLRWKHIIDENNRPYQEYCDKKYFRVVTTSYVEKGSMHQHHRTFVFKKGVALIERLLKDYEVYNYDSKTD